MQPANKTAYWQLFMPYSHARLALNVLEVKILQQILFF